MVNSLMVNNWFHLLQCVGKLIKTPQSTQTHDTIQNLSNDNLNSCLIQCIFIILAFMNAQISHIKLIPMSVSFLFLYLKPLCLTVTTNMNLYVSAVCGITNGAARK